VSVTPEELTIRPSQKISSYASANFRRKGGIKANQEEQDKSYIAKVRVVGRPHPHSSIPS
jgi:hypothetical protein